MAGTVGPTRETADVRRLPFVCVSAMLWMDEDSLRLSDSDPDSCESDPVRPMAEKKPEILPKILISETV